MRTAKFKITESESTLSGIFGHNYDFALVSANNKVLCVNESPYQSKQAAKNAIAAMQRALGSNLLVVDNTGTK